MGICHAIGDEAAIGHLSVSARHFQGTAIAREMAAQGGKVNDETDGLANSKVEGWCCILPDGDRDCR